MPVKPKHLIRLVENAVEVERLIELHERVSGKGSGRRHALEVLNKSGVVLLVACWEKYVEDAATEAFRALLRRAGTPTAFPSKVLTLASRDLRRDNDETKVWLLAGDGWKKVLKQHGKETVQKFVLPLNTPNSSNVDQLFQNLIGLRGVSRKWSWPGMPPRGISAKLDRLIRLRGAIAHEVTVDRPVYKAAVVQHIHFIKRLAGCLNNCIADHLEARIGKSVWDRYTYKGK